MAAVYAAGVRFTIQDVFAGVISMIAIVGIILLAAQGKEVPVELASFASLAAGWLFRGAVTQQPMNGGPKA